MQTATKFIPVILVPILSVLPKVTYIAANAYTGIYERSVQTITATKIRMLEKVGLQLSENTSRETFIEVAAAKYKLHPKLLAAVIAHESTNNADAVSNKGAIGLMQIMPANAKRCGLSSVSKLWDERTNIDCGAQILSEELKNNPLDKALQIYNGGPQCVGKCPESLKHSQDIMSRFLTALNK